MPKHKGAYRSEKRQKEQKRLRRQEEKRQQRMEKREGGPLPASETDEPSPDGPGEETTGAGEEKAEG